MSEDNHEADTSSCASCGIAKVDDIKLKECDDCDLVKYCSVDCEREHKSQHKEACKKRAAELRDELLFKQPESTNLGDCPICMIPLSLGLSKSTVMTCCSKVICIGCSHADISRDIDRREVETIDRRVSLNLTCPFCRHQLELTSTDEGFDKQFYEQRMNRLEASDPVAMCQEGIEQYKKGEYSSAFEWHTKAAGLGHVESHYRLAAMYQHGEGVEKDIGKKIHHMEEAAIGGHPRARHNLGWHEVNNGRYERAVTHYIIAATQGNDDSIKALMGAFKGGFVQKDELAAALRAHKAAVDATKSPQREVAEAYHRKWSSDD